MVLVLFFGNSLDYREWKGNIKEETQESLRKYEEGRINSFNEMDTNNDGVIDSTEYFIRF